MIRPSSLWLILLCTLLLCNQTAFAEAETAREEYEIPNHGILVMDVPVGWQATFYQPENDGFPIISFFPFEDSERFKGTENFQLSVAVFWTDSALRDLTAPENLRKFVENVGDSVLEQSDQDTLELKEIVGHSGIGYLFDLSDEDTDDDEFKYLTQGALAVGNVVVVFSLFTREIHETLRAQTLEMLKTARQDMSRRDISYTPAGL